MVIASVLTLTLASTIPTSVSICFLFTASVSCVPALTKVICFSAPDWPTEILFARSVAELLPRAVAPACVAELLLPNTLLKLPDAIFKLPTAVADWPETVFAFPTVIA